MCYWSTLLLIWLSMFIFHVSNVTAYMAYLGFLHVQVAHKHPVVLVFCQLLWDRAVKLTAKRTNTEECGE